jgi:hypothetical protein
LENSVGEQLATELWKAYSRHGFLYLRGILGRKASTDAQQAVLGSLAEMQYVSSEDKGFVPRRKDGWIIEIHSGRVISGTYDNDLISEKTHITCSPAEMENIWAGIGKLPSVQVQYYVMLLIK